MLRQGDVVLIAQSLAPHLEGLESLRRAEILEFQLQAARGLVDDLIAELPPALHPPIRHPAQARAPRRVDITPDLLPFVLRRGAGKNQRPP